MTQRTIGNRVVESIQPLWLEAIYPPASPEINLNTCGDPDCGNYGVAPDFTIPTFIGPNAEMRKQLATSSYPALMTGRGKYTLQGDDKHLRISEAFEYEGQPHGWDDGRNMLCHHQKGNSTCEISFNVLSNDHFLEESARLRTANGLLEGPVCGNCGTRYLDRPDEFIFNGTHGKLTPGRNRRKEKPAGFRIIHKPCKGKPGARKSISLEHQAQQKQHDNVRLLRALVNGASINDLRRLLSDPDTGKKIGVSRLYSRIFWLEKTLLAFERAKLQEWKAAREASDHFNHMRIAHDDVVISVNWESKLDRRLTALQFSVSADIHSGYVFRIDANFDPRVDPAAFFEEHYLDDAGAPTNLRKDYLHPTSGRSFTVPLIHFQRPSGRFDEPALFASAESGWRVFSRRIERAYEDQGMWGMQPPTETQDKLDFAKDRRALIRKISGKYFGFSDLKRDYRGSFNGMMVKPTYTKAAHLACLKEMLPHGKITLVGEQEAAMARVVPHVFRDMINEDRFEWFVISFDKEASTPKTASRISDFQDALAEFKAFSMIPDSKKVTDYDLLEMFCAEHFKTEYQESRFGNRSPYPGSNFASAQFPQVWLKSPVQTHGETEKVVGFPLLRAKYRAQMKRLAFDQKIHDPDLRAALARRMLKATIQPVSAFMNSLRFRTSPTRRAGGKGARTGPSYINGAMFNPAVLIAILNIYRVYYNWFEARQYSGPGAKGKSAKDVEKGLSSVKVPGTDEMILVPKRRATVPTLLTPAMRLGAHPVRDSAKPPRAPDPRRILYRPWLYHGTPLWKKFETR